MNGLEKKLVLKYVNLIILMALAIFAGCNNPSGGSSIARNHTPLLQPPGTFDFTTVRAANGNVDMGWSSSARVSKYDVFMGTSSTAITTPVAACTAITLRRCSVTGLTPATTYYFSVIATNAAGTKTVTNYRTALSVGSFDITSSSVGDSTFTVSWNASAGATSYNVLYGTSSGSYTGTVTGVTSPYTITGLPNNRNYFVRVVAVNTDNGYALSDTEANGTPFGPPAQPTNLTAAATPGNITLDWDAPFGAVSYKIFRGTTSGSLTQIASGVTSTTYVDNPVTDGQTYFYAVQAFNGFDGPQTSEISVRSISAFNVSSVTAAPAANQLTVTWPAVAGAATYDVQYGTNSSSLTSVATSVTSPYVISSLTGNTTYYVRVVARNAVGVGAVRISDNQLSAIPVPALPAPTGLTATATPGSIALTWNIVSGASTYEVLRGTVSGTYTSLATGLTTNSYTDTGPANGTPYYYVVRAVNTFPSVNSSEVSKKPIASFTISSLSSPSSSSLIVNWPAVAGADAYDVLYHTAAGATTTLTGVTTGLTISGLASATTYYVAVRARNSVGGGTTYLSAESNYNTQPGPPATLTLLPTPGEIRLDWTAATGASSYTVYRSNTTTGPYTAIATGLTAITHDDTTITDGTTYYYVVTATSGVTESAYSVERSARTVENFTLTSVAVASSTSLTVTWPVVAGAATYSIRHRIGTGAYTTVNNVTSPYTITGLTANTTYGVSIVASNSVGPGASATSPEVSAKTATATPVIASLTGAPGQVTINWAPGVTGASYYKIFRGLTAGTMSEIVSSHVPTSYTDTVTDGTQYHYAIVAHNGTDSAQSTSATIRTVSSFTITSVTAPTTSTVEVTWPAVTGADTYDVRYRSSGATTTLTNRTSPFTITGLTSGTTYYVSIVAKNAIGAGTSVTSAEDSAVTPVGAPTGIAAVATPGSVALTWGDIPAASSYKVFRSTTSNTYGAPLQTGIATEAFTDSPVTNGTTYYYKLKSFNGSDSDFSTEVAVKPIASFALDTPTATATAITVNWTTPVDGADSFDIQYRTGAGAYTTLTNKVPGDQITGLAAGTAYDIRVVGKNTVGSGTSFTTAVVSQTTALTGITDLVASQTNASQIGLNWSAKAGVTNYKIFRRESAGSYDYNTPLATTAGLGYLDTTGVDGTTYFYVVRAFNGSDSVNSNEVSKKQIGTFTFSTLTAATSTSLNLTWTAATGADNYKIVYGLTSGSSTFSVDNVTGTSTTLTSLSPNQIYYVRLVAQNSTSATVTSSERNATTAPAAPAGFVATTTTTTSGRIALSWTAAAGAGSYNVYRSTTSNTYGAATYTGITGTSYIDTSITEGTQYYYKISAVSSAESPLSSEVTGQAISNHTLAAPTALSTTSIQVTWSGVTGAATYDVLYRSSGATTTLSNQTSPVTISSLASGTTYYVILRAKNAVGTGTQVDSAEVSVVTPVGAPTGITATASPGSVALAWGDIPAASSYKIYRSLVSNTYGAPIQTGVVPESFTDSPVTDGTVYYYKLKSFNGSDSDFSTEVAVKTISSFTISSVTATASALTVNWSTPVAGADTFDIEYRTGAGAYTVLTNKSPGDQITGLTSGTSYDVRVVGRNSVGAGSSLTTAVVSKTTALTGITDLVASQTNASQIGLNWGAKAGVTNYKVFRRETAGSYDYNSPVTTTTGTGYLDTTGVDGTTYFYVVRAFNGSDSVDSNEVSRKQIGTFTFSTLVAATSTSLNLTWTAATGADNYKIVYGLSSGSSTFSVDNVTGTSTSLTSLTPNQIYYVRLVAQNSSGSTVTSSERNATTAPAAPTGLAATTTTTTSGRIALSWVASAGAGSYNIYRSTTSNTYGAATYTGITGTTYTDTSITEGTQYYYKISAVSSAESPLSGEVTGKAISNFTITSANAPDTTSVDVTWPAVTGADSYDVLYRSTGATTTLSNKTSPFNIPGLTAGTTYYITVRAKNAIGTGTQVDSAEVSAVTPVAPPTALAATSPTGGQINLSWTNASGATSYKIYRSTSSNTYGAALQSGVTVSPYVDTNTISNGTTYYYKMRSFNGSDSAESSEVSIKPIANFTISATATSDTALNVTWGAIAGADSYDLQWGTSTNNYTTTVTGATSPTAITGLTAGTTYYIRVTAKNAVGGGVSRNSSELATATAFGAPAGLAAVGKPTQVELSWSAVAGADSYRLYRKTGIGAFALIASPTGTTYNDSDPVNGTTYVYMVRAFGNATESPDSANVSVQSISAFTQNVPSVTSSTAASVSWGAATGAASYDVYIGPSSGSYGAPVNVAGTSHSFSSLTPNTPYFVKIVAKNAIGAGTTVDSNERSFLTSPAAISNLAITSSAQGAATLTWSNPGGTNTYTIKRGVADGGPYGTTVVSGHNLTSYSDSGLTNGTTYYYVVTANNGTESANSNQDSIQPIANFAISTYPAVSPSQINVTWGAAAGAATYEVYVATSSGGYSATPSATVSAPTVTANITGLTGGSTYYIQVRAKNTVGSPAGDTVRSTAEVSRITPLGPPTISSLVATPAQVVVNWGAVTGATGYRISRGTSPASYGTTYDVGTVTTFTDTTGVANGTVYYYSVQTLNGSVSDYATERQVKPIASFVVGTTPATADEIIVNWTTPVAGADSFDIEYRTGTNAFTALTNKNPGDKITGLAAGTAYDIRIVGKNATGSGTTLTTASVSKTTALGAPTLAVLSNTGTAKLSWNTIAGATYKLFRATSSGGYNYSSPFISPAAGVTSHEDSPGTGTTYYYVIRSNNGEDSVNSNEIVVQPVGTTTVTATVASSSQVNLSWTAASGATSYDVYYRLTSGSYGSATNVAGTSTSISSLTANTSYTFKVVPKNAIGATAVNTSNEPAALTSPGTISDLAITSSAQNTASLAWSNPGGSNTYTIKRGIAAGGPYGTTVVSGHNLTSYTDTVPSNGVTYYYVVTANNGTESANSNEDSIQTIANFSISSYPAVSPTQINVTWGAAAGAATYEVYVAQSSNGYGATPAATVSAPTVTANLTGLTAGTTYYIQVRAKNTVGTPSPANVRSTAEVSRVTPLGPPTISSLVATPGQVVLNWGIVTGATGYRISRGTSPASYDTTYDVGTVLTYTDNTGVNNGTIYYYSIQTLNGSVSDYATERQVKPIASFVVGTTPATADEITVNWTTPVSGADTFDIEYRTGTNPFTTLSSKIPGDKISGLAAGTAYDIRIVGKNSTGSGTTLTTATVSKTTALGAPTLAILSNSGTAKLSWNTVAGASYKIFRATTSGGFNYSSPLTSPAAGVTSYEDSPGTGTTYYYVIRSFNGEDSVSSNQLSVQPVGTTTITPTVASASQINLSWTAASGATSYDVYYRLTSGSYGSATNVTGTSTSISTLAANTSYTFKVVPKNAVGVTATNTSNEPAAVTAPGAPASLALNANNTSGQVSVTWAHNGAVTEYRIYRGLTAGSMALAGTIAYPGTSFLDTTANGLANGTTYYYAVRSYNNTESADSAVLSIEPISSFTLTAATTASSSSVNLTWTASTGADTYDVYYGPETPPITLNAQNIGGAGATSYTLTGLDPASLYYVRVRARSTVGVTAYYESNIRSFTTATAPPTSVVAAVPAAGQVRLTWTNASGATGGYNVWRATTSGGVYSQVASGVASGHIDTVPSNGVPYFYVVRSFNGSESTNSNEVSAQTIANFTITSVVAQSSTSLRVTYPAVTGATNYDVLYRVGMGAYTTVSNVGAGPYDITGLTANTSYNVVVRAKNAVGGLNTTNDSAEVSAMTPLAAPVGLVATGGSGQVSLNWTSNGATYYKIFRGTVSGTLTQIATNVSTNSYVDSTGVSNGQTYFYAVVAYNGSDSSRSAEVSKQPIAVPVISSITGNSTTSVLVTFAAATGAASYDLEYGIVSGTYTTTITGAVSPHSITGLTAGTTYYVRLIAKNAVGGGTTVYSAQSSGAPNSAPIMSAITDQTMEADTFLDIPFTLSDANHALTCTGAMSASSSDTTLLPNGNIVFSGTMPNCNMRVTPAATRTGVTNITVTATDTISPVSQTFALTVDPCVVDSIEWLTQPPASTAAGAAMATNPRVRLLKADGVTLCMSNLDPVALDIETDGSVQGDAIVNAGGSVVPVNGIATFTGVRVQRAGTHTFMASQGTANTDVESNNFTITALTANKIVFQQNPTTNPSATSFIPNPVVRIADTYGNYVSAANVSITLALKNSATGLPVAGATGNVVTTSGGVATYTNFRVATAGSYYVTATPASTYANLDSSTFTVLALTPQNTVSVIELLQGPTITTSTTSTYFNRAGVLSGTNYINGTVTWRFKVIVTNSTGTAGTIRLRPVGSTTNYATLSIPANTTTPTLFTATMSAPPASVTWRVQSRTTPMTIHSAKIVATQTNATKSQIYIPLSSFATNVQTITTTSTSTASVAAPNDKNFPAYYFDPSKFDRIDTADFHFVGTGTNSCARLWNKDLNTAISSEVCAGTSEGLVTISVPSSSLPIIPTNIEARWRSSSGATATFHKAGLMLNMVGINDVMAIQRIVPQVNAVAANTIFNTHRSTSFDSSWGSGTVNDYIKCEVSAATAGSGQLIMKDYGTDPNSTTATNTTTPSSTITASTLNLSNQAAWTDMSAGPLATTNLRHHMLNYAHTSGSFNIQHCIYEQQAQY